MTIPTLNLTRLYESFALALFVGTVSLTLTKAVVFKPLRRIIRVRAGKITTSFGDYVGELQTCPYCMNHWLALFVTLIWKPYFLMTGHSFLDFLVAWFGLVALSSIVVGVVYRALSTVE